MRSFLFTITSLICSVYAEDFLSGLSIHSRDHRELQSLGKVLYFRLVNANPDSTGNIIIEKITNGTIIDLSKYSSNQAFNVEAVTNGTIGSMQFKYNNNAPFRPEVLKPYSMCGDTAGKFKPCLELKLNGKHSVTAMPWSGSRGNGTMGKPMNVFFHISNGISTPTPPIPAPIPVRPVPVPVRPVPVPTPLRSVPISLPVRPLPVPSPVYVPAIEVGRIAKFRLVNASAENIGQSLVENLINGAVIDLSTFPSNQQFSIEAISVGSVGSVVFGYQMNENIRTESGKPYSMCGDYQMAYKPCGSLLEIGFHTVTVTPYTGRSATGIAGTPRTVRFQVIRSEPSVGQWIEVNRDATEIIPRHEACFIMVGRKAYLLGGRYREDNAVDIYDPVSRTWSKGKAPPMEIHHTQCIVVDGKIWIASSWTGNFPREKNNEFIFIYDPVDDVWLTKPGLPTERQRGSAASVLVGRKIYISHGNRGGHETGNFSTSLGWLDYYDIDEEKWYTNLPDAPNPRDHTGGALVNGQICVAGGRDGGSVGFFDKTILPTDCFDLSRNQWMVKANIPQGRAGSAYGTTCDGKLMVAGGEGGGQAWSNVDVFDGESWTTLDPLNRARHGTGLAVDCTCKQIHIASGGGRQGGGIELSSVETYFFSGMDTTCPA